jgi:tetratricopeptide (TPR) repeat protein
MTGMFKVSDPKEQRGNNVSAREILDKASKNIETGMAKDPVAQAQMMQVMGTVYHNLGLFSRATMLGRESMEIRKRVLGPDNPETLAVMSDVANDFIDEGQLAEAVKLSREVLDRQRRTLGPENPQTLATMNDFGDALFEEGHWDEAEKIYRELIPLARRVLAPENQDTLTDMGNLALCLNHQGHLPKRKSWIGKFSTSAAVCWVRNIRTHSCR